MPNESSPSSTNERKPDPVLERLYAEQKEIEAWERRMQEVAERLEREEADLDRYQTELDYHFEGGKNWRERTVKHAKTYESALAAATMVGLAAGMSLEKGQKKQKNKEPQAIYAPAPKPSKDAPAVTRNETRTLPSGIHAVEKKHGGVQQKDTASTKAVVINPVKLEDTIGAPAKIDTVTPVGLPRLVPGPEKISKINRTENRKLSTPVIDTIQGAPIDKAGWDNAFPLPHPHAVDSAKKAETSGVGKFSTSHGMDSTASTIGLPKLNVGKHTAGEHLEPLARHGLLPIENPIPAVDNLRVHAETPNLPNVKFENATSTEPVPPKISLIPRIESNKLIKSAMPEINQRVDTLDVTGLKLPPVEIDSAAEAPTPNAPMFNLPEDAKPFQPGEEIPDSTTILHFKKKAKPAEKPGSGKTGRIFVNDTDEKGNPFDPSKLKPVATTSKGDTSFTVGPGESVIVSIPGVTSSARNRVDDSLYRHQEKAIGDTTEASPYELHVEEGATVYAEHKYGDTIGVHKIPNGQEVDIFYGRGFSTEQAPAQQMMDLEKRKIAGGFTVPEILYTRMDTAAWKKLQTMGYDAQGKYLERVASREDIGPWVLPLKSKGQMMIFRADNTLQATVPFLFGESKGDSLNTYTTSMNPEGKTTPVGTYIFVKADEKTKKSLSFGHSKEKDLWQMIMLSPDGSLLNQGLALHREIGANKKAQEKEIHSVESEDNHETIGCIRVDDTAIQQLKAYNRFVGYVLSEDSTMSYDTKTGKLEKLTKNQYRARIGDIIRKFWSENLVAYNNRMTDISLVRTGPLKNAEAEQARSFNRDEHADEKIKMSVKKDMTNIEVPAFKR